MTYTIQRITTETGNVDAQTMFPVAYADMPAQIETEKLFALADDQSFRVLDDRGNDVTAQFPALSA